MAKIIDTIQFRESFQYFLNEIQQKTPEVKNEFLNRIAQIEEKIGNTSNVNDLAKLDATKKFYQCVAELIDLQEQYIRYTSTAFNALDEVYWHTITNGQKLITEIQFQKGTIENLYKQVNLLTDGWRTNRARWNKERLTKAV